MSLSASDTPARRRGRPRGSTPANLLEIARQEFLTHGYAGTTMEAVAAQARISKQTLYRDHPSKDGLYAAVVRDWVDRGYDALRPHAAAVLEAPTVAVGLQQLATAMQAGILSQPVLQMRTLVASEAARFPDVAADYVARSWERNLETLAGVVAELSARGQLVATDPHRAAEQFTWLVVGAPLNQLTLEAGARPYPPADLDRMATEAVTTFLCRFGEQRAGSTRRRSAPRSGAPS